MKLTRKNLSTWFDDVWLLPKVRRQHFTFAELQELIPFRDLLHEIEEEANVKIEDTNETP